MDVSRKTIIGLFLFLTACSTLPFVDLDSLYGESDFTRYEAPVVATHPTDITYWDDVKPVLEGRCIVCHGCYDSPCQLNLASYEGLARGASKVRVYDGARLRAADPSRLFFDASTIPGWREQGFFPVLNERNSQANADAEISTIHRLLGLKLNDETALDNQPLPKELYDFSLSRAQSCPMVEQMDGFEAQHPSWGMPYGLPVLEEEEYATLTGWIEAGAPYQSAQTLNAAELSRIENWESFLNQDSLKAQLMARYVYEHWFVAHLYFDDVSELRFFQLVRSSTAPGEPINLISTRRPYDDPGVERVYYRFRAVQESILVKTHMPYVLNDSKMENINKWFLEKDYEVKALPSYDPKVASNPFTSFETIPVDAKYRFLLEEARFTIMGFIKGPVCRGQIALNVINDHFWVVFVDPDDQSGMEGLDEINTALDNIRFPAENGSTSSIFSWRKYGATQKNYLLAKSNYLNTVYGDENPVDMRLIWDGGEEQNKNAALSIFRHFDTASVEYGLIGENPQSVWVIEYSLLEKIHYLLVAGFDVYGNYAHQLTTRLYMDFLRMEGEFNFLGFLPADSREALVDHWYRGKLKDTKEYFTSATHAFQHETGIDFETNDHYLELQNIIKQRLEPVLDNKFELETLSLPEQSMQVLETLASIKGLPLEQMPPLAMLTLIANDGVERHLTLLHNNANQNVAHLLSEQKRRLPAEDTLTLVNGFMGAYPNAFFRVTENELPAFVEIVASLTTEEDYAHLMTRFGIRRTHPDFWRYSDETHQALQNWNPIEYGLLDFNRLENR